MPSGSKHPNYKSQIGHGRGAALFLTLPTLGVRLACSNCFGASVSYAARSVLWTTGNRAVSVLRAPSLSVISHIHRFLRNHQTLWSVRGGRSSALLSPAAALSVCHFGTDVNTMTDETGGDAGGAASSETGKLSEYDDFLNNRLRVDLCTVLDKQDRWERELGQYQDLERNIFTLKEEKLAQLRTRVELGSGVYMQAVVPDADKVYVNVGLGFHVECSWDDALRIAELKKESLEKQIKSCDARIGAIRAQQQLMTQGLESVKGLPNAEGKDSEG